MYQTDYDKFQPHFGERNIQLHYLDTEGFILSISTKDINKDFKNLNDLLDMSNLNRNHELFSNKI